MMQLFGIPIDTVATVLVIITAVIIGSVILLALFNAIFFKIGVRNIPRRRTQMGLIVFALMLSTTLISSVLATGDVMTTTVQSVAVYNLGSVDELIEGGHGPLHTYRDGVYYRLLAHARGNPDITAVGAALREQDLLLADQTSRQVRSQVTALAILPGSEQGFGGMLDVNTKKHLSIAQLQPNQVYLNLTASQLLNAHPGDTLYLYSQRWPGKRYTMHIVATVSNDGLVGDKPYILSQLQTFQNIEGNPDFINEIYISNRGGGVSGVGLSDSVAEDVEQVLPDGVHVVRVKQQGVENSQKAQDIFSRVFALFALFALAIGLLLIFLIFVLLAAERRAEMGVARAIGVQRRHLILMFLFEGTLYDLLSSFIGLLFGVGAGILLVWLLEPVLQRFNFPLKLQFQPHSLLIAYCLGVIFTFCSVALSSWLVSRMTVVEAMRDLPEPTQAPRSIVELGVHLLRLLRWHGEDVAARDRVISRRTTVRRVRRLLFEHIPDIVVGLVQALTRLGLVPLLIGLWCIQFGLEDAQVIPFSLGLSLLVIGGALLIKAVLVQVGHLLSQHRKASASRRTRVTTGLFAALVGLALMAYWALPFDALARFGLPRFQGGIEIFFVAGVMMVLGTVWALIANAELLLRPVLALCAKLPGIYALSKLASAYPLQRRFRMGLSVVMFCLVVFAMTVMAIITNAMQNSYVDINTQTGGYDIQATAYFKPVSDMRSSLAQHGIDPNAFSMIGERSTMPVGVIQLSSDTPRWSLYAAQVVSGSFLQGNGLHLTARAKGFGSDSAVWQALQSHPNYALIDSSALPYNPNSLMNFSDSDGDHVLPQALGGGGGLAAALPNIDSRYIFSMSGIYQGDTLFPATPLWITGLQGKQAMKLTVIGVVDNSDNAHTGLYIPQSAYSAASVGTISDLTTSKTSDLTTSNMQSYYFKMAPGQDKRTLALALGSAYLDNGLETTVLEDAVWQVRGPRIFLSNVLLGVVGMVLLLGVAALAITGTRAVIERRQQIGMLRALGCSRHMIQGAFLLESFLVGAMGSILGIVLGSILARNIFAANFFEQYQTGLYFSIPWDQLAIIVGVSLLASFLGALLPAWQAGRIAPAEALRYA